MTTDLQSGRHKLQTLENKGYSQCAFNKYHSNCHSSPSENVNNQQEFIAENHADLPVEISRLNAIIDKLKSTNAQLQRESNIFAAGIIERNAIIAELTTEIDALKMELAKLSARSHL